MAVTQSNSDVAQRHDIIAKCGDTFQRTWYFKLNGVDEDVSLSTFKMRVIKIGDTEKKAIIEFTHLLGLSRPDNFRIRARQNPLAIKPGKYWHDVQRTYPDGTVITFEEGFFVANNDATPA